MKVASLLLIVCSGLLLCSPALGGEAGRGTPPSVGAGTEQGRPWDLSVRVFLGYDSNYPLAPETSYFQGETESLFFGTQVFGEYRFVQRSDYTLGVVGGFETRFFPGRQDANVPAAATSDPNDYDLLVFNAGLFGQHRFEALGLPWAVGLRYDYRHELGEHIEAIGLSSHRVTTDLAVDVHPDVTLKLAYSHRWDDHDVAFATLGLPDSVASRDGNTGVVRLSGKWRFDRLHSRSIELYYTYVNHDADGFNWAYGGNGVGVRLESHLLGPVFGAVQFDYLHRNYARPFTPGFAFASGAPASSGRTEQHDMHVTGQLIFVVTENISVDVFTTYSVYDGGISDFEADRITVGLGATYKF